MKVNNLYSEHPWNNSKLSLKNNLHTTCSYMAMFPPTLPNYFINKYSSVGDMVLDPFSGRGTTVLEACKLNRVGVGNDLNPLAYVLTKSKVDVPLKKKIVSRIDALRAIYDNEISSDNIEKNIRMLFHKFTLKQLLFLKNQLNWKENKVDSFITAMLLGIMHGGSEGYLSLSMPNTFAMSPNYIRKYVKEHHLRKPKRDVFNLLLKKLDRIYEKPIAKGFAYQQDARNIEGIQDESVNLIVTSPPYTRVISYGQYNWIRLWFLEGDGKLVDKSLFFTKSVPKYLDFMTSVLKECKRVLTADGTAVFVIGDVKDWDKNEGFNLAKSVWENCAKPLGFNLKQEIIEDRINPESKVSKIWGKKKGNATKVDRILVLKNNK